MKRFLHAHSVGQDWLGTCRGAVAALGSVPESACLGFVYVSDSLGGHLSEILDLLRSATPVRHWVGSVGSGIVSMGRETYETPAISLMVTDLDADAFRIIPVLDGDTADYVQGQKAWRETHGGLFAVVHGDPRSPNIPRLVAQLSQGLDGGFLVGGLSSAERDDLRQIADAVCEGGISGVLFSSEVAVATGLTQGCSLIGHRHEITAGDENVIAELDGRPAVEVFREEIGEVLARNLERVGGYIFAALPIQGSDTGDYLVRNLLGIDMERGLLAIGDQVREGQQIQFARRDPDSAREDLGRMLRDLKSRLRAEPRGALYYSCLGRGRQLFGPDSEELRLIREGLGDIPLTGFFANGEISHNRLYGYTGVLAVFL